MKRILSIVALMIYTLSVSTLLHANTMGFFSHTTEGTQIGHCQTHAQSAQTKTKSIDCCELAISNEYLDTQTSLEYKDNLPHTLPIFSYFIKDFRSPQNPILSVAWSPGRNPDIKYSKFSDLFGIIVNLS